MHRYRFATYLHINRSNGCSQNSTSPITHFTYGKSTFLCMPLIFASWWKHRVSIPSFQILSGVIAHSFYNAFVIFYSFILEGAHHRLICGNSTLMSKVHFWARFAAAMISWLQVIAVCDGRIASCATWLHLSHCFDLSQLSANKFGVFCWWDLCANDRFAKIWQISHMSSACRNAFPWNMRFQICQKLTWKINMRRGSAVT